MAQSRFTQSPHPMPTKKKGRSKKDDSLEAVAKRLGADEDMDKFLKKLGKIANAKPKERKHS